MGRGLRASTGSLYGNGHSIRKLVLKGNCGYGGEECSFTGVGPGFTLKDNYEWRPVIELAPGLHSNPCVISQKPRRGP